MIFLSSITYIIANKFLDKQNFKNVRIFISLTFLLGIGFVFFQLKGYRQIIEKGANPVNPILVTEGKYGDYFEIKYQNKFLEVNANDYLLNGKVLTQDQYEELKDFVLPFEKTANPKGYYISKLNPNFSLYFQGEPVVLQNNKLRTIV